MQVKALGVPWHQAVFLQADVISSLLCRATLTEEDDHATQETLSLPPGGTYLLDQRLNLLGLLHCL